MCAIVVGLFAHFLQKSTHILYFSFTFLATYEMTIVAVCMNSMLLLLCITLLLVRLFFCFFFVSLFVCGLVIRVLSLCQCEHRSYQMTIPFRVWCSLSQIECCVCLSRVLCTHAESVAEDHYASVFLFGVLLFFCVQTMNFADLLSVSFYLLIVSFACVWSED